MKLNFPTLLTLFRVILIPFFVIAFYLTFLLVAFFSYAHFFIAAVTDWFDGYLARKWNQSTPFGAFLDPVADKVMVIAALSLVMEHYHSFWLTIPALIMISRELIISALREWMAEIGSRNKVAVSWLGKVKNNSTNDSISGLLWRYNFTMEIAGFVCLYIAAILTVWSMLQYLKAAKDNLLEDKNTLKCG